MRLDLIAFLLLFTIMNVCANVHAQDITLSKTAAPLKTVLLEIKKQSGMGLWLNNKHLKESKPVTIDIKKGTLKEVLDKCFEEEPLTYEIVERTIVVKPKPKTVTIIKYPTTTIKAIKITGNVTNEKGHPLSGVTVRLKGTNSSATTNNDGYFEIEVPVNKAVLVFSFVGFQTTERTSDEHTVLNIILKEETTQLSEVGIVNTGYQQLPKERATGSFVQINNELLNRRVSTNILDRLEGVASGLYFNGTGNLNMPGPTPGDRLGINIRGESTILSSKDPLVVIDNFPYSGELKNINPNDIESITILKDAAAASIWGARSGNGVIVMTTKKGKKNKNLKISLNGNVTFIDKPNLYKLNNYISSSDYIDVEKILFDKGFFDQDLNNADMQVPVSPVVDLLAAQRSGTRSATEVELILASLRNRDVRKDFDKYVYRQGINQQYTLGLQGGSSNLAYRLSLGLDRNLESVRRNGYNRTTINSYNAYTPLKNLEISLGITYSSNSTIINNLNNTYGSFAYAMGGQYTELYPYANLADNNGDPVRTIKGYRNNYIDQWVSKGYLDWGYRPLQEIELGDHNSRINNILFSTGAKYKFTPDLNFDLQYQNERQLLKTINHQSKETYYARDLVNRYSQVDPVTGRITNIFPAGGVLTQNDADWKSNNVRLQGNYHKEFGKHYLNFLTGFELRELKSDNTNLNLFGYDDQFGTSVAILNYQTSYPVLPSGSANLPTPLNYMDGNIERYISYYANGSYTYNDRYQVTISGRRDGSNIFGVNTNKKITPLWSSGLGWLLSKESFYPLKDWLPYLKLRGSYGFNGNLRNTSAYLTGIYSNDPLTGYNNILIISAPNPELRWEKIKNINMGLDFASGNNRISGTLEYFIKNGSDLLQNTPLATQTGFSNYISNAANTKSKGIDLTLQSKNLVGSFNWSSTLLVSSVSDKIVRYDPKPTSSSIATRLPVMNYPLHSLFSYRWGGLDPENGDPMGYLNGMPSKDYNAIINNFQPDSLVFNGTYRPKAFGSFRNDFSYKGFSLSVNMVFKLAYYFRRPTISTDYADILGMYQNSDYSRRWKAAGDEAHTSIPSLSYPSDPRRNTFYQYSDILVQPGDHLRIQDVRLSYDVAPAKLMKFGLKRLQLYGFAQNLGIIWRKNKNGLDPEVNVGSISPDIKLPMNLSFGLNADF